MCKCVLLLDTAIVIESSILFGMWGKTKSVVVGYIIVLIGNGDCKHLIDSIFYQFTHTMRVAFNNVTSECERREPRQYEFNETFTLSVKTKLQTDPVIFQKPFCHPALLHSVRHVVRLWRRSGRVLNSGGLIHK